MSQKLNFYVKDKGKKNSGAFSPIVKAGIGVLILLVLGIMFLAPKGPIPTSPNGNPFEKHTDNGTKVSFVEFSDYECPFCAKAETTIDALKLEYQGKVNFVFKHFPVHGAVASKAAEAAECARDQGLFDAYSPLLFKNQGSLGAANLKKFAAQVGADQAKFDSCLDSGVKLSQVTSDFNEGVAAGVQATPTFFVNGIKIEGAQSPSVFKQAINSELSKIPA